MYKLLGNDGLSSINTYTIEMNCGRQHTCLHVYQTCISCVCVRISHLLLCLVHVVVAVSMHIANETGGRKKKIFIITKISKQSQHEMAHNLSQKFVHLNRLIPG